MNEMLMTPDEDDDREGEGKDPDSDDFEDLGEVADPDTDSDPEPAESELPLGVPVADAIPEARPVAPEAGAPGDAAPARPVAAHYTLLAACTFLAASGMAVWQRSEIFGSSEVSGAHSVSVTLLFGLALYGVAATIANIGIARLPCKRVPLLLALGGLALTVRGCMQTVEQTNWMGWEAFEKHLLATTGSNFKLLSQGWLGQFAPGIWLAGLGSLLALLAIARLRKAARAGAPQSPAGSKESFRLLFGASFVVAAGFAVWQRATVYDGHVEVTGFDSVSVSLLFAFGLYSFVVGIANVVSGRMVPGMPAAFIAGVCGLWFGIRGFLTTWQQNGCLGWDQVGKNIAGTPDEGILTQVRLWLGQFAPGPWVATIGGLVIVLVFLKGILAGGGKKAAPAAAPTRRRSR